MQSPEHEPTSPQRRRFLGWAMGAMGASLLALITGPSLWAALSPLRRRARSRAQRVPVATLDELAAGFPRRVEVVARSEDAWERHPKQVVGTAWLVKHPDQSVTAFSSVCPHAGCAVDFDGKAFVCPCHHSTFAVDGRRLSGPAPRGLDPLEVEVKGKTVELRYARFKLGQPTREES